MVVRRWSALALLLLAPKLWAATLTVRFPATQLEAGRTVRVEVSSSRTQPSLAGLDLSPWAPWLVLQQHGDVAPNPAGGQTLVVWLVPRAPATGRVKLPPLVLGPLHGGRQAITIVPARAVKGGEAIVPRFSSPPRQAWLHQQLIYTVSVVSRHRYLQLESEPADLGGFETLAIPQQVEAIGRGEARRYRHIAGWLLFPSRPGRARLQLPAVRYGRDGVTSHRFYPPPLDLVIRPLPAYLPPSLAVGRIEPKGGGHPVAVVRSGDLQARHFSVVTRGILPKWWRPPTIVADDDAVHLYEAVPDLQQHIDASGLTVDYHYALPLTVSDSGWHRLAAVSRLYAFDPMSGKLQASKLSVALPLSLYWWQELLLWLLLAGLLWFGGGPLWRSLCRHYRFLLTYRSALKQLQAPQDLASLREVLTLVARAEGWPVNLSLQQWHLHWRHSRSKQLLAPCLDDLEQGFYAGVQCQPGAVAEGLGRALRARLGLWRWICEFRL